MKLKRITLLVLVLALLGTFALAEAALDARLESGCLKVDWRGGTGECTLTLYMDGWPAEVLRVQPSGSLERAVEGGHSYMARLNMSGGCLTADAGKAAPTAVPTVIPTPEPTAAYPDRSAHAHPDRPAHRRTHAHPRRRDEPR